MTTPITEYVNISVSVDDKLAQFTDFGQAALAGLFTTPSSWASGQRVKEYTQKSDVLVDFPLTSKIGWAATAYFTDRTGTSLKILNILSGDANIAAGLDACEAYDADWYGLFTTYRLTADIEAVAAWIAASSGKHIYVGCAEDADIYDSASTTDTLAALKASAYDRAFFLYHHNGGIDLTAITVKVASGVATATKAAHGLRVGDTIVLAGNSAAEANGVKTVATVADADTFTYDATGAADDAVGQTQTAFARYLFPEGRWLGYGLSADVGSEDWGFKTLVGQDPTPTSLLNLTQQRAVRNKNGNVYTEIDGENVTQVGKMVSGRFIDTQVVMDWLQNNLEVAVFNLRINVGKVPYTQAGINSLIPVFNSVIDTAVKRTALGPLADSTSGETRRIVMPQLADISTIDRAARNLPAAQITVQLAGSIVTFNVDVSALV